MAVRVINVMNKYDPCPCGTGKVYDKCCKKFHDGILPAKAVELMRSRYCAYAINLAEYIIDTTHKDNPNRVEDRSAWKSSLESFSTRVKFERLKVLSFEENKGEATVTFKAFLSQDGHDISFVEESKFKRENGKWLYLSGVISD